MVLTDLEKNFFGAIFDRRGQKKMVTVVEKVKPEYLSDLGKLIFTEAVAQWKENKAFDLVTICSSKGLLEYSTQIASATSCGSVLCLNEYIHQISKKAREERLGAFLVDVSKMHPDDALSSMQNFYTDELSEVSTSYSMKEGIARMEKKTAAAKKRGYSGIPANFGFFDECDMEYAEGHIWVVTGSTSTGKTAFSIEQVCRLLRFNHELCIVIISVEMTEEQMISRIIANLTGIYSKKILKGELNPIEEEKVDDCKRFLSTTRLVLCDNRYELGEVEQLLLKESLQGGVDFAVIDYVQNLSVKGISKNYEAQSVMAKRLQKLAKSTKCTIQCLSQVSNDVARGNTDNFEAKGAGEWGAVADVGIQLMRSKKDTTILKVLGKKHRHGPLCDGSLRYVNSWTRLADEQIAKEF